MSQKKARLELDQPFTPWEESFINLVQSFEPSKREEGRKKSYLPINQPKSPIEYKQKSMKKQFSRTFLTLSKVNIHNKERQASEPSQPYRVIQKRYEGPRITFYSKMNPKCLVHSKRSIDKFSLKSSIYQSFTPGKASEIQSISYQSADEMSSRKQNFSFKISDQLRYKNLLSDVQKGEKSIKRTKEEHLTMKRLKYLYNCRKHTKT